MATATLEKTVQKKIEEREKFREAGARKLRNITSEVMASPGKTLIVTVSGTSPLIMHKFGDKALKQMLEGQVGKKKGKETRKPIMDAVDALYLVGKKASDIAIPEDLMELRSDELLEEGIPMDFLAGERFSFPVTAFKKAMTRAAQADDKKMAQVYSQLIVWGQLNGRNDVELEHDGVPVMHGDPVRVGGKGHVVFRPRFESWSATFELLYRDPPLKRADVLGFLAGAGAYVGIGDWRPEKTGTFGMFEIVNVAEVVED